MHLESSKNHFFIRVAFFSLLTIFLAACGSSGSSTTSSGGATSATPTATCPSNSFKTAMGTIQRVTGTSFLIQGTQGSPVQAMYATTTRIQREVAVTSSTVKEGSVVTIAVKQDASGNYTATRITLVASRNGVGGFGSSGRTRNANCFRQGGAFGGGLGGGVGTGAASGASTLTGTTGQLSGSTLSITDSQGSNYTVTLNAATQIIQFQSTTASALKSGAPITLTGSQNSRGMLTAQSITILLPTSSTSGTPTT